MRGRLRVDGADSGQKPTWAEVPREYWSKVLTDDSNVPVICAPNLQPGCEIPQYGEDTYVAGDIKYFSLKIHHGGDFDKKMDSYVGGKIVCDLQNQTCACRKWQLTGIPCFHACACIFFLKESPLNYMHQCHQKEWYLMVYSHILEPLNGEEFWEETFETPILPPKHRIGPGRPKKKRDKKSDVVQTRENNPTILKRTGTSLRCTWCSEWGHNARTCRTKKIDEQKKRQEEGIEDGAGTSKEGGGTSKNKRTCGNCQQLGHNKRTCTIKKSDAKKTTNKPTSAKEQTVQAPVTISSEIKKQCRAVNGDGSHGGIRAFKPPVQKQGKQCLGVEPIAGQKYTTLKNLEAAALKKKNKMPKKD